MLFLSFFVIWYYYVECYSWAGTQTSSGLSEKVVRAMTFSGPLVHALPLFFDLQILKLDDIYHLYVSSFVYECYNNFVPNHFSDYFTQVFDIHHYNTRSAFHSDFFLKRRNTLQYGLRSVLMEQKSLLISETLHQLEASVREKDQTIASGVL